MIILPISNVEYLYNFRFGRELNQLIEGSNVSNSNANNTTGGITLAGGATISSSSGSAGMNGSGGSAGVSQGISGNSSASSSAPTSTTSSSLRTRERSTGGHSSSQSVTGGATGSVGSTGGGRTGLAFIRDHPLSNSLARYQSSRRGSRTASATNESHARRDTLSYVVSLLRAHKNEHCDTLPDLDVGSLKHIAYVFDALISYMKCCESDSASRIETSGTENPRFPFEGDENDNDDEMDDLPSVTPSAGDSESADEDSNLSTSRGKKHAFFVRSQSTLCLGSQGPDVFSTPLHEAIPLADKPHLLQPNARREELFGIPRTLTHNMGEYVCRN